MNANANTKGAGLAGTLIKADPNTPALFVTDSGFVAIKAGTIFNGRTFDVDTTLTAPDGALIAGRDYIVMVGETSAEVAPAEVAPTADFVLGGFHFAPGGNGSARRGGGETPAINPFSLWDVNYRPAAPDPRGMTLVEGQNGKFWADIYLLGRDHLAGTSRLGETIADGDSPPRKVDGNGYFDGLDYPTAVAVLAHHGKQLLSYDEFRAAAYGVTERSAVGNDPKVTKLDAPRTSRFGLIQPTGNMWQWGTDGDPDDPRPSLFGGDWWYGVFAGSRQAYLDYWPGNSYGVIGARGRCDHLQPE